MIRQVAFFHPDPPPPAGLTTAAEPSKPEIKLIRSRLSDEFTHIELYEIEGGQHKGIYVVTFKDKGIEIETEKHPLKTDLGNILMYKAIEKVIFDFSNVESFSQGAALVLNSIRNQMKGVGMPLRLCNLRQDILDTAFERAQVKDKFKEIVKPDLPSALEGF